MRIVYKYPLYGWETGQVEITTSSCNKPLLVEHQGSIPCAWFEEPNPDSSPFTRTFIVVGTGHEIPENTLWVASWQHPPFVWHLYEYPMTDGAKETI